MTKKKAKKSLTRKKSSLAVPSKQLVGDLRQLIGQTRHQVSVTVNAALVLMYWNIGKRIREDVLENERAEYGKEIVQTLSAQLTEEFGSGFGRANFFAMVQFAEVYPDLEIVQTLSGQLSWSHFTEIIRLEDSLKRDFYAELCRLERYGIEIRVPHH